MGKKALEMQFNWIFILIAGAIILSFFMGVFSWYKASKNSEMADQALVNIKATLTSAQASSDTAKIIDIPEVPLDFYCFPDTCGDSGCNSYIEFKGTGVKQDTEVDIIFATDEIESGKLLTWTVPWEAPYKIADILYLSNPKVRYILVYDDDFPESEPLARKVDSIMSDNKYITRSLIEVGDIGNIKDQNDYLVKFILFFEPSTLPTAKRIDIDPSLVNNDNWDVIFIYGDESKGSVKFSRVENKRKVPDNAREYPYVGTPLLLGAIFSESPKYYECNLMKAYKRMEMVNYLYWKRTELLASSFADDPDCSYYYDSSTMAAFDKLNSSITGGIQQIRTDIIDIDIDMEHLKDINSKVLYRDCPRLY